MLRVFCLLHSLAVPPSLFLSLASLFSGTQQYCVCFFFFLNMFSLKKNMYYLFLAALGLSCNTQDSFLHCTGSVAVVCRLSCPKARGILVLWPGIKPMASASEGRFLTTGPPGKSQDTTVLKLVRLTTLQWLLNVQVKGKSRTFL